MTLAVGDIITFPKAHESKPSLIGGGGYGVRMSHGVPGKFRVTAIDEDGTIHLEKLEEGTPRNKGAKA